MCSFVPFRPGGKLTYNYGGKAYWEHGIMLAMPGKCDDGS
jgi:hypothetical protein